MYRINEEQFLPVNPDKCWEFFSNPANLEKISPPDMQFKINSGGDEKMFAGQIITYRIKISPLLTLRWVTEITHVDNRNYFIDEQRFGPYKFWHHLHRFTEVNDGVKMEDIVHYELPFGPIGELVHTLFIKRKLRKIFEYRKNIIGGLKF